MIGYFALIFAVLAVNALTAVFFILLSVTLGLCAVVLICIRAAGRYVRKPNGMVP